MKIPKGTIVAVADGGKLNLFRNNGEETAPKLDALPAAEVPSPNSGSGGRHPSSAANPSESQEEDSFADGVAATLNRRVLDGGIDNLIIVAPPRTLGELRKHYHKSLAVALVGEVDKDLAGHSISDIERSIAAA